MCDCKADLHWYLIRRETMEIRSQTVKFLWYTPEYIVNLHMRGSVKHVYRFNGVFCGGYSFEGCAQYEFQFVIG